MLRRTMRNFQWVVAMCLFSSGALMASCYPVTSGDGISLPVYVYPLHDCNRFGSKAIGSIYTLKHTNEQNSE